MYSLPSVRALTSRNNFAASESLNKKFKFRKAAFPSHHTFKVCLISADDATPTPGDFGSDAHFTRADVGGGDASNIFVWNDVLDSNSLISPPLPLETSSLVPSSRLLLKVLLRTTFRGRRSDVPYPSDLVPG